MTTIGINALFIRPGMVGGAEHMLYNLVFGLTQIRETEALVIFARNLTPPPPITSGVRWVNLHSAPRTNRFIQETVWLPKYTRGYRALLSPNYFTPPIRTAQRNVTVIHDLQYIHLPENFSSRKRLWLRAAHLATLRWADAVVAISQFVRGDILEKYGDQYAHKVHVIPNPVSWERFPPDDNQLTKRSVPSSPYILSVAAFYPHKNLQTLVKAFRQIHRVRPDFRLVLAGQLPEKLVGVVPGSVDIRRVVDDLGLSDAVTITGHVTDAELGNLYRGASLFVFPSLFEGFGMPAVEALGFGIPVLTTKCGALPEVTRGLAQYLDNPLDSNEMAERMIEMLDAPYHFAPSQEAAQQLRETYSPERVAASYRSLLLGE